MDFRAKIIADLDTSKISSQLQSLNNSKNKIKVPVELDIKDSAFNKFVDNINKVAKKINLDVDTSGLAKGNEQIRQFSQSAKQLSNFKFKIDTSGTTADISSLGAQIKRLKTQANDSGQLGMLKDVEKSYSKLAKLESSLSEKKAKGILNKDDLDAYNTSFKTTQNKIKILKSDLSDIAGSTNRIKLTSNIESWLNTNTKATESARKELREYVSEMNNAGNSLTKGRFNEIQNSFKQIDSQMKASGNIGHSWFTEAKNAMGRIGSFVGVYGIIQQGVQTAKQMTRAVLDVDTAMTELRKVSDASDFQLNSYFDEAATSAKKYGANISDVIKSTSDWKRLGYSLEDSKELSNITTLLQRVGDNMTQESSASGLISTLKGFGKEADEAKSMVDMVNEVANTKPIDTAGIFAGLERSASSMDAANNSLEQTIALITAANSVVQDPDVVGTSFKTISMRIRGATTELEKAGLDTDGMAESTAKLREEMLALSGIDIMKDATTFKSTYNILDELANKWENLTDIQQASVTELIAGRHHYLYVQKCA